MSDQSQLQSVLPDWRCTVGLGESQSDLLQILQSRYMHPVVLLHGPTGFGKRHLAHWFGAALLCARNTACGICGNCKEVIAGIHPDVFVVQGVDHGAIKTAEVESLQSKLDILSSSGLRIAIIPNCDRMTKEAANRLLKSLEEPPEQVRFILTTSRPKALLPTVLGRCLRFRVKPPKVELVLPWLRYEWSLASKDVFTDESLREMIHRVGNAPGELKRKIEDTSQRQDQLLQGVSSLWSARQPQDVIRIAENLAKGNQLPVVEFLSLCEWSLNDQYRNGRGEHDISIIGLRRRLLNKLRRLAVLGRIHLNTQLAAESIGLLPFAHTSNDLIGRI